MAEISFHNILHQQHAKEATAVCVVVWLPARGHCPGCVCCRMKDRNSYSACWRVMRLSLTAWVNPDWNIKQNTITHQADRFIHTNRKHSAGASICTTHLPMMLFAPGWHAIEQLVWLVDYQIWPLTTTTNNFLALKYYFYLGWDMTLHACSILYRSYIHIAEYILYIYIETDMIGIKLT